MTRKSTSFIVVLWVILSGWFFHLRRGPKPPKNTPDAEHGDWMISRVLTHSMSNACSDDSLIGQKAEQLGIKCTCLTRSLLDLENPGDVEQAVGQIKESPGADVWLSLAWQHVGEDVHAKEISKRLRKGRKKTMKILDLAIPFLEAAIENHGRIAAELPRNNGLWETRAWVNFMTI